jgi:hypothetical protein
MLFRTAIRRLAPLAVAILLLAGTAEACPTCKEAMQHDPASMAMIQGYFWSILFMMSMPFLTLLGVGGYFYWEVRKARARAASTAAAAAPGG